MALLYSQSIPFGSPAPDFSLPGIDGKTYTLANFTHAKALVIVFMCNHCPYVQACWERLIALQREFGSRGAQLVGINANDDSTYPEDSFENMKKIAPERGQNFPYLRDATQETAKAYGAVCTPDIFVYQAEPQRGYPNTAPAGRNINNALDSNSNKRILAYHGRIDDNWKEPEKVTRRELAEALESLLLRLRPPGALFISSAAALPEGKKPPQEQQPSMGCSIKWK